MATECFPKEVETRLKVFFSDVVDVKDMAKMLRQVNYALSLSSMRGCETLDSELCHVDDNFYWLNRLAEVLDPYLGVD
ncbi:hypothetical protein [Flavobacterium phragmitis]|uniref:Uncharacterized protein n=1 Tax=Flavobacterium phragmitis TaxID=739143 RepID=A0A1I1R8N5_9FLAO|nr:hypothetical protein [Flavobacterium phragmitis]SFD30675.1 hypothetical protein SAMN05216297_106325 [Flavobacterium phragmitis]